uniref:Tyrosinase-like protein 2 n=1 Tax=Margaritifera margaritifera TaxID=102329 RepID=TYRO2_PINMG|nr:RecName: Full=Tyrosinase-like protein 2; AltName: Full=Tyrosinase 2; Flags: Precursor [Pinctada margaritifera]CCE46152.1 tyrosinase 2 [Pinctada margaritifera]
MNTMALFGKVILLQFLIGVGFCMLMQDPKRNDTKSTYATCFRSQPQGNEPASPDCVKAFMAYAEDMKNIFHFTKEQINYLWSLERETQSLFHNHRRRKRQAVFLPVRKECRLLSEFERQNLFYTIRSLKMDTSNPNEYDTLANLHRGAVQPHAHDGSNFLGWHRVYLMYYERALRRIRGDVTLCFWDTTMDFNLGMDNWEYTAVFSSDFFGNRRGQVITGPFRDWPLPPGLTESDYLYRNMTRGRGMPFDSRAASSIFYNPNTIIHSTVTWEGFGFDTITNSQGQTRNITIEGEHNNVHNWVGGAMEFLDPAPQDPVFFFHHCYIDYVWERFREKMRRYFRDPTTDYPGHGNETLHDANYPMIGFEWFRNIDGYSDYFIQNVYRYESPTCQACYYSPYTVCGQGNQCIARMNYPGTEIEEGPQVPNSPVVAFSVAGGTMLMSAFNGRGFIATSNSE